MRPNRKARRAQKFQQAEKGFGPRHAFNAQEGDELVPEELPTPPTGPPDRGDRLRRMILDQVIDPETRAEIARNPTGAKAMAAYASLGIMLMPGHEGGAPRGVPKSGKVPQPGLKVPDMAPRYEGPESEISHGVVPVKTWDSWKTVKGPSPKDGTGGIKVDSAGNHYEMTGSHESEGGGFHIIAKPVDPPAKATYGNYPGPMPKLSDDVFPSLNKPPYDALKEPIGGESKDPSFSPEEVQKMEDLKDFLKPPPKESIEDYWKKINAYNDSVTKGGKGKPSLNRWDYDPNYEPPEGLKHGTGGVRQPRKFREYPPVRKVGAAKGFGPRHTENSKEGDLTKVNTDTVPAMLTPREAVLNRNAAELAGRGNIEQLNEQGNELAKKGVDLASGESNIPDPKASDRRLAGTGAASYLTRQLLEKYGGSPTAFELVPDFVKYISQEYPQMAQKGTANMKPKPKSPPSKPKPSPKPAKPQSGSPYVQGFQKLMPQGLQGGGYAADESMPGLRNRNFPHPMAGKMHPSMPGLGGTGMQPYAPQPLEGSGGPGMLGEGARNFPHPMAGKMHGGGWNPIGGGGSSPGWNPTQYDPGLKAYGGGGVYGEPSGSYGANMKGFGGVGMQPNIPQGNWGGGGFYPPGQGLNKPYAMAEGSSEVPGGIGTPNPQKAYSDQQVDFKAPDLSGFIRALHEEGKKQGLSESQMAGIAKQFGGMGSYGGGSPTGGDLPYDQLGGQYASFTGGTPGYQGGISEVGYPPGIAPNADFSYEEGGWTGPLDPRWSSPGYVRGSDDIEPGILGGNRNADSWLADFPPGVTVFGGRHPGSGFINRSSYNPGAWSGGAPGMPWSPTRIPTTYNPQGYPYAVPVLSPDQASAGPHPHTPPKSNS